MHKNLNVYYRYLSIQWYANRWHRLDHIRHRKSKPRRSRWWAYNHRILDDVRLRRAHGLVRLSGRGDFRGKNALQWWHGDVSEGEGKETGVWEERSSLEDGRRDHGHQVDKLCPIILTFDKARRACIRVLETWYTSWIDKLHLNFLKLALVLLGRQMWLMKICE